MFKPTYVPIYFPPTTRRPSKLPSFRSSIIITTFPSTIPTIVNTIKILKANTTENKLSELNQLIIIVSVSVFCCLCIIVTICIFYDKRDKKQRDIQFRHWLSQEADIRIANMDY